MKVYNCFADKFGNEYRFADYAGFSKFWFGLSYQIAKSYFPDFQKLQNCAANSKEARTKI
jgi:hypothetical protein